MIQEAYNASGVMCHRMVYEKVLALFDMHFAAYTTLHTTTNLGSNDWYTLFERRRVCNDGPTFMTITTIHPACYQRQGLRVEMSPDHQFALRDRHIQEIKSGETRPATGEVTHSDSPARNDEQKSLSSKNETLTQCCFNVGPAS